MKKRIPVIGQEETFHGYIIGLTIEPMNTDGHWSHHMYAVFQYNGRPKKYLVPDSVLFKKLAGHLIDMSSERDGGDCFGLEKVWIKKVGDVWDVQTS